MATSRLFAALLASSALVTSPGFAASDGGGAGSDKGAPWEAGRSGLVLASARQLGDGGLRSDLPRVLDALRPHVGSVVSVDGDSRGVPQPVLKLAMAMGRPLPAVAGLGRFAQEVRKVNEVRPADSHWTLERLVEVSLEAHPSVLARRADVAAAGAGVEAAEWQFFPTPSVRGEQFEGKVVTTFSLRQPLWTGGRLTADLESARSRLVVANRSVDEVRFDLAQRVAVAWSTLVLAVGRVDAYGAGVKELEGLEAMMVRRLETRLSAQIELDLLQARLGQARSDLRQAQADERAGAEALSQLVGRPIAARQVVALATDAGGRAHGEVRGVAREQLVQQGLLLNPVLKRLEAEVHAAAVKVEQARTAVWPTLYARMDHQHGRATGSLPADTRLYVGFEQSFGAGLSTGASVRAAEAGRVSAQESLEAARREAAARIVADAEGYHVARQYVDSAAANLAGMEQVSQSYRRMFLAGKRGWLDLLNMVREQTEAARLLSGARVQVALQAFRLKLQLGDASWVL